ncbi:MAG: 4Fe-4S dicluster domain-containing protein [Planctomycetota bacterium]|jgi:ferredoxin
MHAFFISKLKPFLDAVSQRMDLYVPKKSGDHYVYSVYGSKTESEIEFNDIRVCTPVKEFLFPMRELAATYPEPTQPVEVEPFAVFGLKDCDLRSIAILDKVFQEDDFEDPLYINRRKSIFIISSDCPDPGDSCFCNLFDGEGYSQSGYDLNVSKVRDGFIVEAGSQKGEDFVRENSKLFTEAPETLLAELKENRNRTKEKLERINADMEPGTALKDIVETSDGSEVYDQQAETCIECQACTRVCPTCHCFYLYDSQQKGYFSKMKMWDSCMRFSYATVAGGANPNKILGDRMKHRLMHKFVYFLERYGINMCVGCGRCVDADAGGMDLREILKQLSSEIKENA